jgi:hypothetical protein
MSGIHAWIYSIVIGGWTASKWGWENCHQIAFGTADSAVYCPPLPFGEL